MLRRRAGWSGALVVVLLWACGGDSTGPSTGSLAVTVSGLPGGTAAVVTVAGPGGYTRELAGSQTLGGLTPGNYTVTAAAVAAGDALYAGSPASQTVLVSEGNTPAAAQVTYAVTVGGLVVTIAGLPPGADAAVTVSGPNGFTEPLTESATLPGIAPGNYTVSAVSVSAGGFQYTPSPSVQQVAVSAGATASATVTYAEDGAAGLNYRIDGVHLTQSVQTYAGTVPLVAGRDGYLRVFVTASEANVVSPDVRVRFYHGAAQVAEQTISRVGPTPLLPQEGTLSSSWNLAVSKALIQADLSIEVQVDPDNLVPETNEGDNFFPGSGQRVILDVRTATQFLVNFVPVETSVDGRLGNVSAANRDQFLAASMRMHPLSAYDAVVAAPLVSSAASLQADNGNNAWNTILGELHARRVDEGGSRHYTGVVNPSYSSGVAGIGFVGHPVSLVWDKVPSASSVAAHEWGHNWNRKHAPCGGAGDPDGQYPYSGGVIGVYGFDLGSSTLKPTTSHDLMGYCNNEWISDYTYRGVMQFRAGQAGVSSDLGQAVQPTLVVWGRIEQGGVILEPAFQTRSRPSLPTRDGPYTLEARAGDGSRIFALRFTPLEVGDDPGGTAHFAYAVPLSPERAGRVASLRLEGPGGTAALARSDTAAAAVSVTRSGVGRAALRWDASRTPMVVVRHPRTGEVLSFARGGRAEVPTDESELLLTLSNRLQSREARVRVAR